MDEINVIITGMSTAVPQAISTQVSAHSTGQMQINSALNQQRNAMNGISSYVMGVKKMSPKNIKLKQLETIKKERF
ncbi:RebB family R body protein [Chryseobacterium sp. MEBOG07]|uniref:RebB family R body protein n=1 Tax=Chryseobacterium sp. MEBOG07 TaxID=2879939 RepID=UPI001F29E206|nr:RebB family R body protein [Chryseobacterium sp. MEBOG07]UKB81010.1 RebB family R body protein [Chryseobacterium sp. MEBOG07]